ncbi:MAG: hypothetical protein LBB55_04505, partial [Zoogloeaceae bacterium]|nr:hypothetical protein [Zoogloeaceae bacterium]
DKTFLDHENSMPMKKMTVYSKDAIKSGGKNLAERSASAKSMHSTPISSLRGPQARGNPDGLSACFAVPENGTAARLAMTRLELARVFRLQITDDKGRASDSSVLCPPSRRGPALQ